MDLFDSTESEEISDSTEQAEIAIERASSEDFNSGLNQSLGIEPQQAQEPEQAKEPSKEEAKSIIAGMTEDELRSVLDKAKQVDALNERLTKTHDTAFGKIGHLEQQLRQLAQAQQQKPAATQLTKESFAKLTAYMDDEEMAAALAEDLSAIQLGGGQAAEQIDWDKINSSIDQRILQIAERFDSTTETNTKEFEKKLLTIQHPDWTSVVVSDEYQAWKGTLSKEAQETLDTSWDGTLLGNAFTKFKAWKGKKAEVEQKNKQRLENAITAGKGSGGSGRNQSADSDFNQGLRKAGINH